MRRQLNEAARRDEFMAEIHHCLLSGPGVFVIKRCVDDHIVGRADGALQRVIQRERLQAGGSKGDHFAASGANDRIWNSFQKHAEEDPESFVEYYANPIM